MPVVFISALLMSTNNDLWPKLFFWSVFYLYKIPRKLDNSDTVKDYEHEQVARLLGSRVGSR